VWRLRKGSGEVHIRPSRNPSLWENQAFEGVVLGYIREGVGG
jgi:CRISPR-associated protein Csm5